MSWISDFFGSFATGMGNTVNPASNNINQQGFNWSSLWPVAIQSGAALVGGLLQDPYENMAYQNTPEGFAAAQAQEKEIAMAQIEAARANAAASVGAQVAAAKIAKDAAMRSMLMKNEADALAYKLDAKKSGIQALQKARENILAAKLKEAELMSALYHGAAGNIMAMRK